jgi:lysophospholipid acyltransferase (LPLAT)-like uncharacterized protein
MIVPIPFTRAIFLYGDPITIGREDDVEQGRLRVERALNTLADEAEQQFENLWKGMRDEG